MATPRSEEVALTRTIRDRMSTSNSPATSHLDTNLEQVADMRPNRLTDTNAEIGSESVCHHNVVQGLLFMGPPP